MAVLYNFSSYRACRLLRSFSQETASVARQLGRLSEEYSEINIGLERIQEAQCAFSSQLDAYLFDLERSKRFARTCSQACELNSVEEMTAKRDQLVRTQRIH